MNSSGLDQAGLGTACSARAGRASAVPPELLRQCSPTWPVWCRWLTCCGLPSDPDVQAEQLKAKAPAAIIGVKARQVFDSRGNPTVEAEVKTHK